MVLPSIAHQPREQPMQEEPQPMDEEPIEEPQPIEEKPEEFVPEPILVEPQP